MLKSKTNRFGPINTFIDPWQLNRSFVSRVESITDTLKNHRFGRLQIQTFCVDRTKKLPCLHFRWRGTIYPDLAVSVDLVPAFKIKHSVIKGLKRSLNIHDTGDLYAIPKGRDPDNELLWAISFHPVEHTLVRNLPPVIRMAYILAKALRVPDISLPIQPQKLKIIDKLATDEVISSYMLKTSLLSVLSKYEFRVLSGVLRSAIRLPRIDDQTVSVNLCIRFAQLLFEELKEKLEGGSVMPYFSQHEKISLLTCPHTKLRNTDENRRCCHMRETALEMCTNILRFLSRDQDYDQDITLEATTKRSPLCNNVCCFTQCCKRESEVIAPEESVAIEMDNLSSPVWVGRDLGIDASTSDEIDDRHNVDRTIANVPPTNSEASECLLQFHGSRA